MTLPQDTDEVVSWLLGDGHLSLMDSAGRPIGERASPRYPSCPHEERVVPFGDLRDPTGLPANIAALRQVAGCLDGCMHAFASLLNDAPADHARMRARTEAMCLVAPLLALREGGEADVEHASAFKLCLGFREMQNEALLEGRVDAEHRVDVDATMKRLALEPLLVGDAQVCAGSVKQIRAVLLALLEEGPEAPLPTWGLLRAAWFHDAVAAVTALHELVAIAASTALGLFEQGQHDDGSVCAVLAQLPSGPRISQALRARTDRAPLRVTLLHRADAVPVVVRRFIDVLATHLSRPQGLPVSAIDDMLLEHARPIAGELMRCVGRPESGPLSLAALRALG